MNTSFHALGETILQEVSAVVEKIDEGEAMDLAGAVAAAGRVLSPVKEELVCLSARTQFG